MKRSLIVVVIIGCILFLYDSNNRIVVSNYEQVSNKVNEDIRVVQISDLHNKNFDGRLEEELGLIEFDYLVLTGDMIDRRSDNYESVISLIKSVDAEVFYVTGNHEATNPISSDMILELSSLGVTYLSDEMIELSDDVVLTGINDPLISAGVVPVVDSSKFNILLAHHPENIEFYSEQGYDLVFSGHAHGGQIILPVVGAVIAPNQGFFPKYYRDQYVVGNTTLMVSRGLGNSIFPVRINNLPQIVVYDIIAQK